MIEVFHESFEDCYEEMVSLFNAHWAEVGHNNKDIEFLPDFNKYVLMDRAGTVHTMTARKNGKVIGYMIDFINYHMHHMNNKYAINDVFYVIPGYRKTEVPYMLLKYKQEELKQLNVKTHIITMMETHKYESLATKAGYSKIETNWAIELR